MIEDYEEIVAAVQKYVDGEINADEKIQAEAFHEGATIHAAMDGQLWGGPISMLLDLTAEAEPNPQMKARIDVLDVANTIAVARVILEGGEGPDFVDFHCLVKTDDGWKVVAKVFDAVI